MQYDNDTEQGQPLNPADFEKDVDKNDWQKQLRESRQNPQIFTQNLTKNEIDEVEGTQKKS